MKQLQINLDSLPSVSLNELNNLPSISGIYVAFDCNNRFLYIGKANNIFERWKSHHRKEQLSEINQGDAVRIAWLPWNEEDLDSVESYLINRYQPLFNNTRVTRKQVIPSEVILRELLQEIRLLIVVIGITTDNQHQIPTVYTKYNYENSGKNGCASVIKSFCKNNKERRAGFIKRQKYGLYRTHNLRPGSREHKQISRIKSSYNNHWTIPCNGVIIDITPLDEYEFKALRNKDNSAWRKLAGIKIRALTNQRDINSFGHGFTPMTEDPLPLLWQDNLG